MSPVLHGPGRVRPSVDPRDTPAAAEARRAQEKIWAREAEEEALRYKSLQSQIVCFIAVLGVWQLPIVNPFKVLVVLFHESWHCLVALLTGGTVTALAIDPAGAGVTVGYGGWPLLIVAAGYPGSLAVGALLYALAAKWRQEEVWTAACLLCGSILLAQVLHGFTAVFGWGTFLLLVAGGFTFRPETKKFFVRVLATTSCLYPIVDVAGEFVRRVPEGFRVGGRTVGSDAAQLAALTGLPEALIAVGWMLAGMALVAWLAHWSMRADAQTAMRMGLLELARIHRAGRRGFQDPLYDPSEPTSVRVYRLR